MGKAREQLVGHLMRYSPPLTREQVERIADWMELEERVKAAAKAEVVATLAAETAKGKR